MSVSSFLRTRDLRLYQTNGNSVNYVSLKAPANGVTSYTLTFPATAPSGARLMQVSASGVITFVPPATVSIPDALTVTSVTGSSTLILRPSSSSAQNEVVVRDGLANNRIKVSQGSTGIYDELGNTMALFSSPTNPGTIELRANRGKTMFFEVGGSGDFWFNAQATGRFRFSKSGIDLASISNLGTLTLQGGLVLNNSNISGYIPRTLDVFTSETATLSIYNAYNSGFRLNVVTASITRIGNMVNIMFIVPTLPNSSTGLNITGAPSPTVGMLLRLDGIPARYAPFYTFVSRHAYYTVSGSTATRDYSVRVEPVTGSNATTSAFFEDNAFTPTLNQSLNFQTVSVTYIIPSA